MYEVIIAPQAQKGMKHLKKIFRTAVSELMKDLKEDPFCGKLLSRELADRYTYKIGVFRVIYVINREDKKVFVVTVGHRAKVYD